MHQRSDHSCWHACCFVIELNTAGCNQLCCVLPLSLPEQQHGQPAQLARKNSQQGQTSAAVALPPFKCTIVGMLPSSDKLAKTN